MLVFAHVRLATCLIPVAVAFMPDNSNEKDHAHGARAAIATPVATLPKESDASISKRWSAIDRGLNLRSGGVKERTSMASDTQHADARLLRREKHTSTLVEEPASTLQEREKDEIHADADDLWPEVVEPSIKYIMGAVKKLIPKIKDLKPDVKKGDMWSALPSELGRYGDGTNTGVYEEQKEEAQEYYYSDDTLPFGEDCQKHVEMKKAMAAALNVADSASKSWSAGGKMRMTECMAKAMESLDIASMPLKNDGKETPLVRLEHWTDKAVDELFDMMIDGKKYMGGKLKPPLAFSPIPRPRPGPPPPPPPPRKKKSSEDK